MSTYQYYEFLAVDGPISDEGLTYARSCSSRADVSRYRWVNSYHWGDFSGNEDELLPPIPSGMNALTDGLRLLAEQMQIDEDVLQAAMRRSSDGSQAKPLPVHDVLDALSVKAMKSLLVRVSEGEGDKVKAELIRRTLPPNEHVLDATGLTCGEFSKQVIRICDERMRAQERDKEIKRRKLEKEQRKHLDRVYERSESIWAMLDQLLVNKTRSAYDTAAKQLKELRDAYFQQDDMGEFLKRMSLFRGCYGRRPALIRRLDELADFM